MSDWIKMLTLIRRTSNWLLLIACLSCFMNSVSAQSDRLTIEQFDAGFEVAGQGILKIGRFNPIRVVLKNGPEAFTGKVQFLTDDPDGIETRFEVPIQLAPGQITTVRGLICPGQMMPRVLARIVDEYGRPRLSTVELPMNQVKIVDAAVRVVGVIGVASGIEQLANLPGITSPSLTTDKNLVVFPIQPDQMPGRTEGLSAFDAIVLDTSNPTVIDSIDAGRSESLRAWIADGGHLVVVSAAQRQALLDSSLKPILPALPVASTRTFDLGAIESLVGSRNPIVKTGQSMIVTKFDQIAERGGMIIDTASSMPIIVRGIHGFGRVTMLGIDVHDGPFAAWKDRTLFWAKALELKRQVSDSEEKTGNNPLTKGGGFYENRVSDIAVALRSALDQFPGIRVFGFGLIVTLILAYLLAIGPIDYLLVRRVFKRPELTWVTFPLIVVLVTGAVYFVTYAVKGRDLRVNKIDLLDLDYVGKYSRGWSTASVFSPVNADYNAEFAPAGNQKQPLSQQFAKSPENLLYQSTSWYDSPDQTLGGSARPATLNLSTSGYEFGGFAGTGRMDHLRIPIWSTKTIVGRWMVNGLTLMPVRPAIARTGTDRVIGRITNLLDEPLTDAILVYQAQVYDLGTIEPGASVLVNPTKTQNLTGYLDRYSVNQLEISAQDWANEAKVKLPRVVMFHDSGSANIRKMSNGPFARLDLSSLLPLNRPMLVARVNRPVSQLTLENSSTVDEARVDQITIIRCLLPLDAEETSATKSSPSTPPAPVQNQP